LTLLATLAVAISTVVVDGSTITVNVPIEVIGSTDEMIALWKGGIDQTWNRGNDGRPFEVCGRKVIVNAIFLSGPSAESVPRNVHVVVVEQVEPGQRYMSRVWHALGTSPSYSSRTGFWGSDSDAATAAHEFGHLLGLLDEYVENDRNANGLREPGETPVPNVRRFPDAWMSLMAREGGAVLHRHIKEVLRIHGAETALSCTP
jgi:hypothetical protein